MIFFIVSCGTGDKKNIQLSWEVTDNYVEEDSYLSTIKLTNQGEKTLEANGWVLYFNNLRPIRPESFPNTLHLTHINGDFYKIEPTEVFTPLRMGESYSFSFATAGSAIKKSDAPDGFYFEFDNGEIAEIQDVEVQSFKNEKQYKRGPDDHLPYADAEYYYEKYDVLNSLSDSAYGKITPAPFQITSRKGSYSMDEHLIIFYNQNLESEALFLSELIHDFTGFLPKLSSDLQNTDQKGIHLQTGVIQIDGFEREMESYELTINKDQISITASDASGIFYGIQSLRALIYSATETSESNTVHLNAVQILDFPRFGYRGFHLDVARNFQTVETVKRLLEVMSHYKLNKFHFHLTDDEGWRIAIDGLPELAEIGGRRGHTKDETDYLIPSYGSGPDPEDSKGSGWYSRDEFVDLLKFAKARHIEVIPEIDLPGHARAAIVALKAKSVHSGDDRFRLDDPSDESVYRSIQGWNDNVINVCMESSYMFIEKVLDEIVDMFDEAGDPLKTVHVGGDEVPEGVWKKSPVCENLINENHELESPADLQDYFFKRIQTMLNDRGVKMAGWEEVALGHPEDGESVSVNKTFIGTFRPHVWSNVWGGGREDYAYRLANAGYQVVMSHATDFYFDMAYDHHPDEPGFYWASFIDAEKPFNFIPFDLFKNGMTDNFGRPLPESYFDDKVNLTESAMKNILGLQGQLWGETLKSSERVEYMAIPRLLSLAERAWAPQPAWALIGEREERIRKMIQSRSEFIRRVGYIELKKLDDMKGGYYYRVPPPGITLDEDEGIVKMNREFPGLTIRYTLDGTEPGKGSMLYREPIHVDQNVTVKAKTFTTNNRSSRTNKFRVNSK